MQTRFGPGGQQTSPDSALTRPDWRHDEILPELSLLARYMVQLNALQQHVRQSARASWCIVGLFGITRRNLDGLDTATRGYVTLQRSRTQLAVICSSAIERLYGLR